MFKVSVNFTPRMIIENVLRTVDNSCKAWAVTEAIERGAGGWDKVCRYRASECCGCNADQESV